MQSTLASFLSSTILLLVGGCTDLPLPDEGPDEPDPEIVEHDVGEVLGCLDESNQGVVWTLQPGELFCVDIGWTGGNSPSDLLVQSTGTAIELVSDFYEMPPPDGFDMPARWGQVYRTTEGGAAELLVQRTALDGTEGDLEEIFRLSFTVAD